MFNQQVRRGGIRLHAYPSERFLRLARSPVDLKATAPDAPNKQAANGGLKVLSLQTVCEQEQNRKGFSEATQM